VVAVLLFKDFNVNFHLANVVNYKVPYNAQYLNS